MKYILFFAFICLFKTLSFGQDFNIRGFIYNKENGEAAIFEKVLLLKIDSSILTVANTDVNGFFSFPKIEIGEYIVKIDNGNFKPFTENISVKEVKGILSLRFELEEDQKFSQI